MPSSTFTYFFIQSLGCINIGSWISILLYGVNPLSLFILFLKLFQICSMEAPLKWPLCLSDMLLSFIKQVFAYFPIQAHLVLSLPQLWSQPFLQEALVSFIGEWHLETKRASCAHCYWGFVVSKHLLEDRARKLCII